MCIYDTVRMPTPSNHQEKEEEEEVDPVNTIPNIHSPIHIHTGVVAVT